MSVQVVIGGSGQSAEARGLVEEIAQRHRGKDWWEKIDWLGWVSNTDAFFTQIDLLLFTSKEFDPLPTVIIEAGMAAVPVVATNVGGVPELIVDGETGRIFEPDAPEAAADTIEDIARSKGQLRQLGMKHHRNTVERFSSQRMLESYVDVWSECSKK